MINSYSQEISELSNVCTVPSSSGGEKKVVVPPRSATLAWQPGPSGIPGYPGIPGLNKNPDPGILENTIPGFFAIFYMEQNNDFKEFYWFLNKKFPKNPGMNMLG